MRAALASANLRRESDRPTISDSAAVMVRRADGQQAVLKVATSQNGMASLRREGDALDRLQSDKRLGEWRAMLPVALDSGDISGGSYLVTSRLPGVDGRQATPDMMTWLTPAIVDAVGPLHLLDTAEHEVDAVLLGRLVEGPIAQLRATFRRTDGVDRLEAGLQADLAGRCVTLGWTHGDLALGNVMVIGRRVTGIVDWGNVREHDLTILDLALWLLTVPGPGQPREIGARVASRLRSDQAWLPAENRLLAARSCGDPISGRALLLLAWLRHITDNLAKSDRYADSPVWSRRNVTRVLRVIDGHGDVATSDRP
ncbi:MAG: aminoglycoside phosphotransferase family protein [Streptosporangiaceae bacterium]